MKKRWIKLVSWLLVAIIFCFVLMGIVPEEEAAKLSTLGRLQFALRLLMAALSQANILGLVTLCLAYMVFLTLVESAGTRWLIDRFNCRMTFAEILPARAVTFLVAVLNYQAGQLAIPLYLKRVHQVPLKEGMGSIVFLGAMDLFVVILLGTLGGLGLKDEPFSKQILLMGALGVCGYGLHALFWRQKKIAEAVNAVLVKIPFLGQWINQDSLFHAFRKATFHDYSTLFFLRVPIVLAILFSTYLLILAFGSHVPLGMVLVYGPVIMLISTVPILNVGSIGVAQAGVVYFFRPYAPDATLLAVSLTWALAINLLKVMVGAIFLHKHSPTLFRSEAPENG